MKHNGTLARKIIARRRGRRAFSSRGHLVRHANDVCCPSVPHPHTSVIARGKIAAHGSQAVSQTHQQRQPGNLGLKGF